MGSKIIKTDAMQTSACPPPTAHRPRLSWHGWQLALPEDWSPVKIEGDWNKGSIVIADFHTTRLLIRWQSAPKRKFDADAWTRSAIAAEVGQLMLEKSVEHVPGESFAAGRLFVEPEPPGRDVWVGQSSVSNRLLEVVHQTKSVNTLLRDQLLPALSDQKQDGSLHWSIFDLSCTIPPGWKLTSQRLNAGDLTLSFGMKNRALIVRQLAPAKLALARQSLERWLDAQQRIWKKTYRGNGKPGSVEMPSETLAVIGRTLRRRRRFFLARWMASERVTLAAQDHARDRLVFVDADSSELARDILATVGKDAG